MVGQRRPCRLLDRAEILADDDCPVADALQREDVQQIRRRVTDERPVGGVVATGIRHNRNNPMT